MTTAINRDVMDADGVSRLSDLDLACQVLTGARSIVILAHVHPDADALGSALALGLAMRRLGAAVQVGFGAPERLPNSLSALPGVDLVTPVAALDPLADLVVTTDVNTPQRLGATTALFASATATLVIDHHTTNPRFGRYNLVDPTAESTTVLVAEVLDRLGAPIDAEIAANLYAGLATDTVGFRHASASAHRLAARLLECGVVPDDLMRPITDTHPASWLGLLATVLGRAELISAGEYTLVWTSIPLADSAGLRPEELDSVIDILRTTAEAQVAAVFKELDPGHWQVSLRSLPGIDVAAVATRLGGGGHRRAAGFSHHGTVADGVLALRETFVS